LPLVVAVQAGVFWYLGLYRGVWRFSSIPDLVRITKAVLIGTVIVATTMFLFTRLQGMPRSIFPLYAILMYGLLGGPRFAYRWFKDRKFYSGASERILIVGAGNAGEMLSRDLARDPRYRIVAFVDDDPTKKRREIHGIPVAGSCEEIPRVVSKFGVSLILIAVPAATSKQIRRIHQICETTSVPVRILPRLQDLASGHVSVKELRDVRIDDLLGRESISLDWKAITKGVAGKAVMVTGGGGSIGSELCRQIARLSPATLIVFEHSELNLYQVELELRKKFPNMPLVPVLGDVCDGIAVERVFQDHKPQVVFHAAAYKHVPMLEGQVRAAVENNVFGTRTVAAAAVEHGSRCFVLISTDKAVNPANVMGMSKRVAEIDCQIRGSGSKTRFVTVRFGNVLGSAGSVIPLFQSQISSGGPVTVTHPEIKRYFMTIPEACQLILQAAALGKGGEIFVLDMGEPVKISDLAEQLIRLSGKKPGEDIEIVYTGLRPGEKLYEELFHDQEKFTATKHPKILLSKSRHVDVGTFEQAIIEFRRECDAADEIKIRDVLVGLVPEHVRGDEAEVNDGAAVIYPWKGASTKSKE
jgi:FlaA1/EpsC-like NDP-sugar epimerase